MCPAYLTLAVLFNGHAHRILVICNPHVILLPHSTLRPCVLWLLLLHLVDMCHQSCHQAGQRQKFPFFFFFFFHHNVNPRQVVVQPRTLCVRSRVPSTARAIQSRLEIILQLIAQLMSVVQLQQSTLLPLLRVACQTLTVQGLDLLQIKAAGIGTLGYATSHCVASQISIVFC